MVRRFSSAIATHSSLVPDEAWAVCATASKIVGGTKSIRNYERFWSGFRASAANPPPCKWGAVDMWSRLDA